MVENFYSKAFELVWKRGLGVILVWAYAMFKIFTSEDGLVFGFEFNDTEKSLVITMLTLFCIAFHFGIKALLAVHHKNSPKSYRDEVFETGRECLALASFLTRGSRQPQLVQNYGARINSALDILLKLPPNEKDALTYFSSIIKYAVETDQELDESKRVKIHESMAFFAEKLQEELEWVHKK